MEFSKKLAIFLIMFGVCGIIASYVLAFLEKKTVNDSVTIALITQIMVACISYLLYQYRLKNSRNVYGIDKDGVPFDSKEDEHVSRKNKKGK